LCIIKKTMKKILLFLLLIPTLTVSQKKIDSLQIFENKIEVDRLQKSFIDLEKKYDYQTKINEQTLNSISNQIGATSYNLSIFAFLFGLLAIILGMYVTWVERKIIKIREENESLLKETIKTKEEVVSINQLIQKDINGLFLKIKREETIQMLNRLSKVPDDVSNLLTQLFSRELLEEDYPLLKKAYLKLEPSQNHTKNNYKLLFFQHFLDQSVKDEKIGPELINYYNNCVDCANLIDIIKSTEDFMKAIIDLGIQSKSKEINSYIKAISKSNFKDVTRIYKLIFDSLKTRNDRFKFYEILSSDKEIRIGKINFGLILNENYGKLELSNSETGIFKEVQELKVQLKEEEEKTRLAEEKEKKVEEKKRSAKETAKK
jgi:hypothetical protein